MIYVMNVGLNSIWLEIFVSFIRLFMKKLKNLMVMDAIDGYYWSEISIINTFYILLL